MAALSKKTHDLGFLRSEFEHVKFELFSSNDLDFINCIVCWFDSPSDVASNWKALQSIVSVKFKPEARFSRWNIYLVMLCSASLDVREKYIIENDRYAARKIILDGLEELPTTDEIEELINIELLGADLKLQVSVPKTTSEIQLSITPLIKNAPVDSTIRSKEKRGEIVQKLIEHYKRNENKEG